MRQSIGGSWLIGLMILFIMLFVGYIILTIDYNKSIRVKNEAISLLEKYEGLNDESITLVNNYLKGSGYLTMGQCGSQMGMYGAVNLEDSELEETEEGQNYYYCVKKYKGANTTYYYQITLFYRFNLPVLGDTIRFTIKGSTSNFQAKDDPRYAIAVDGSSGGTSSSNMNNNNSSTVRYTVMFNSNGGSAVNSQSVLAGSRASEPIPPTREGYVFNGWKLSGNTYNFYSIVNSDITLVAEWSQQKSFFTVKRDYNGGYDGDGKYSSINYCQKGYKITAYFSNYAVYKDGYTFSHFIDDKGNVYNQSNPTFTCTEDINLKVIWKKN